MTTSSAEPVIVALFRHDTWANLKLIDACMALTGEQLDLTAPGTFGSVQHTLTHIIGNEENYLDLLTGQRPEKPLRRGESLPLAELRARAQAAGEALTHEAGHISMTDMRMPVFQGEVMPLRAYIALIQAINHGAEHRTHIATILSQHGITPPAIDGWAYGEEVARGQ